MIALNKCNIKPCPGHRTYMPVHIFIKDAKYLTMQYHNRHHVFVASCNEHITDEIKREYRCEVQSHPLLVPKSISDTLCMDFVLILNSYCDIASTEQVFDVYYVVPTQQSIQHMRHVLLEMKL